MKKLVLAVALATLAFGVSAAEDAAKPVQEQKAAEQAVDRFQRPPVFDRAKFEERMKKRRAEQKAKVVEILKANGIADEAKANEVADAIEKVYVRQSRAPRPANVPNGQRPGRLGPRETVPAPAQKE